MTPLRPDCPGQHHHQDEGEHHNEPYCPWEEGRLPEGHTNDTEQAFCSWCYGKQVRSLEVNTPQATKTAPNPSGACTITGEAVVPGEPCVVNRCCERCDGDPECWEGAL